jgi:predicted HAD superfamily phosphohydrolase
VRNAEVAVVAESNIVTAALADLYYKHGKEETLKALSPWGIETLKGKVDDALLKRLTAQNKNLLKVQIVTNENMASITKESSEFRKKVRGVAVGRLG